MDRSGLQNELRQIKRRRIEIRGARAALDMEDLDLDDRESALEQLLQRVRTNLTPLSLVDRNDVRSRMDEQRSSVRGGIGLSVLSRSGVDGQMVGGCDGGTAEVKKEPDQGGDSGVAILIEDDDDCDFVEPAGGSEPVVSSAPKWMRRKSPPVPELSTGRHISARTRSQFTANADRPSKVVVLKVRYDPETNFRGGPMASRRTDTPMFVETSPFSISGPHKYRSQHGRDPVSPRLPLHSQPTRPSPRQTRSIFRRLSTTPSDIASDSSFHPIEPLNPEHHNQAKHKPAETPSTSSSSDSDPDSDPYSDSEKEDECPCGGRRRNCRTCHGTPAVIAEGRRRLRRQQQQQQQQQHHHHYNQTHPSDSPALRLRPRPPRSRPNYQIPQPYSEIAPAELHALERRLCHRILLTLLQLSSSTSSPPSPTTPTPTWTHILSLRDPTRWSTLLSSLTRLRRFKDLDGLESEVRRLCQVDDDDDEDAIKAHWCAEFWTWFQLVLRRCRACVDSCVLTETGEARRALVEDLDLDLDLDLDFA